MEAFSRWYDKQGTIDDINEKNIKMKKVERDDLKPRLDDLKVEKEKIGEIQPTTSVTELD